LNEVVLSVSKETKYIFKKEFRVHIWEKS